MCRCRYWFPAEDTIAMSSLESIFSLSWGASDDDDSGSIGNNSNGSTATSNGRSAASPSTVLPTEYTLTPCYHHSAVDRAFNPKKGAPYHNYDYSSGLTKTAPFNANSNDTCASTHSLNTPLHASKSRCLEVSKRGIR